MSEAIPRMRHGREEPLIAMKVDIIIDRARNYSYEFNYLSWLGTVRLQGYTNADNFTVKTL